MKAKNEILAHLQENGYSNAAITKITGFLIGNGMKEDKEGIRFKRGQCDWDDFYGWLTDKKPAEKEPIYYIFAALFAAKDRASDVEDIASLNATIDYFVSKYVLDTTSNIKTCAKKNKHR